MIVCVLGFFFGGYAVGRSGLVQSHLGAANRVIRDSELSSHFAAPHITEANRHLPADHRLKPINYSAGPAGMLRFHTTKGSTSPLNERHRWRNRQRNCNDKEERQILYIISAVLPKYIHEAHLVR